MKTPASRALNKKKGKPYDHVGEIMAYEDGSLPEHRVKRLFQHLVDSGQAWHLQGSYGRTANEMLRAGYIKKPKNTGGKDTYGNNLKDYHATY